MRRPASLFVLLVAPAAGCGGMPARDRGTHFAPGWNGLAKTPPLAWRSWNAFHANINQDTFTTAIDAILKKLTVAGHDAPVSLYDLGFTSVGIDEGWEGCGAGVNGTQHYVNGTPAVNNKFPDLASLVKYAHDRKVEIGWYQNASTETRTRSLLIPHARPAERNGVPHRGVLIRGASRQGCACGEHEEKLINYEGDVSTLHALGFDSVKIDVPQPRIELAVFPHAPAC